MWKIKFTENEDRRFILEESSQYDKISSSFSNFFIKLFEKIWESIKIYYRDSHYPGNGFYDDANEAFYKMFKDKYNAASRFFKDMILEYVKNHIKESNDARKIDERVKVIKAFLNHTRKYDSRFYSIPSDIIYIDKQVLTQEKLEFIINNISDCYYKRDKSGELIKYSEKDIDKYIPEILKDKYKLQEEIKRIATILLPKGNNTIENYIKAWDLLYKEKFKDLIKENNNEFQRNLKIITHAPQELHDKFERDFKSIRKEERDIYINNHKVLVKACMKLNKPIANIFEIKLKLLLSSFATFDSIFKEIYTDILKGEKD